MKNLLRLNKFILTGLLTIISICGQAQAGGTSGGGGHEVEAGFKAKLILIANELSDYMPAAKAELKFDVYQLKSIVESHGLFQPKCATGATLDLMKSQSKQALVLNTNITIVNLDCTEIMIPNWKALFASTLPGDSVFFLHEGLRSAGVEGENDYSYSSSYLNAKSKQIKLYRQTVNDAIAGEPGKCWFQASTYHPLTHYEIRFSLIANNVRAGEISYSTGDHQPDATDLLHEKSKIISGTEYPYDRIRESLINEMIKANCFQ